LGDVLTHKTIGIEKLKNNKLYSKLKRNSNSLVRDHMFGRYNGFKLGVFPEILRHPANCQIISHSENMKKSKSKNDTIITLEYLFERIINWGDEYFEQKKCIQLISEYNNGGRYCKEQYIENYFLEV